MHEFLMGINNENFNNENYLSMMGTNLISPTTLIPLRTPSSSNTPPPERNSNPTDTMKTKWLLFRPKTIVGVIFLVIVLGSNVLSKLTLVSLTARLKNVTYFPNASKDDITSEDRSTAVTLYWYLQLVLLIPNFITFFRCFAFGVLGKTTKIFPWPKKRAFVWVSVFSSVKSTEQNMSNQLMMGHHVYSRTGYLINKVKCHTHC